MVRPVAGPFIAKAAGKWNCERELLIVCILEPRLEIWVELRSSLSCLLFILQGGVCLKLVHSMGRYVIVSIC